MRSSLTLIYTVYKYIYISIENGAMIWQLGRGQSNVISKTGAKNEYSGIFILSKIHTHPHTRTLTVCLISFCYLIYEL